MKLIKIPEGLVQEKNTAVNLIDYYSSKESTRQEIELTKNVFSFLVEGQKEIITNNTALNIDKTSFLLMKTGQCLMTEKLSVSSKNYRSLLLAFSDEEVIRFMQKYDLNGVGEPTDLSAFSFDYDKFTRNFVEGLLDFSEYPISMKQKMIRLKLEEILVYLTEKNGPDFLLSIVREKEEHIQNFINIVERYKFKKMTVKELAFLSNMSVSTFKREFEKRFHGSPSKWFLDKRLEYAAFVLKNQSKRASDIYEEMGYENLSNFIHAFKVKFGMTPKQYQKK